MTTMVRFRPDPDPQNMLWCFFPKPDMHVDKAKELYVLSILFSAQHYYWTYSGNQTQDL